MSYTCLVSTVAGTVPLGKAHEDTVVPLGKAHEDTVVPLGKAHEDTVVPLGADNPQGALSYTVVMQVAKCLVIQLVTRMNGLTRFPLSLVTTRRTSSQGNGLGSDCGERRPC